MLSIDEKARRIQALSVSERTALEQRQTQELVDLITTVIEEYGSDTELPMLGSDQRRAVIKAAGRLRPKFLAAALRRDPSRVQSVSVRRADA